MDHRLPGGGGTAKHSSVVVPHGGSSAPGQRRLRSNMQNLHIAFRLVGVITASGPAPIKETETSSLSCRPPEGVGQPSVPKQVARSSQGSSQAAGRG